MKSYTISVSDEMEETLEKLAFSVYPHKSETEIIELLLWRGLERTSDLLREKGRAPNDC